MSIEQFSWPCDHLDHDVQVPGCEFHAFFGHSFCEVHRNELAIKFVEKRGKRLPKPDAPVEESFEEFAFIPAKQKRRYDRRY